MCRSFIMSDRTLQIERVQISDEGFYVCRVENSVGWREAEARLVVHCKTTANHRLFIICRGGSGETRTPSQKSGPTH